MSQTTDSSKVLVLSSQPKNALFYQNVVESLIRQLNEKRERGKALVENINRMIADFKKLRNECDELNDQLTIARKAQRHAEDLATERSSNDLEM